MAHMFRRCSRLGSSAAVVAGVLTACGPSNSTSPGTSLTADPQITGGERIAWTQIARATDDLHFAVYVDARTRVELSAVCTGVAADTFTCESPIPPLPAGRHSLELVAWVGPARSWGESARSAAVFVRVNSSP